MRVLALDLSTHTGVAYDWDVPARPKFETWELVRAGRGQYGGRFVDLETRMRELLQNMQNSNRVPDIIAFEEPLMHKKVDRSEVRRLLIGLASIAEFVAAKHSISCIEVPITKVKTHFGGKPGGGKEPIMARCRQLGWKIRNDNEADAGALWSLVKCTYDRGFSHQTTPMFSGGWK